MKLARCKYGSLEVMKSVGHLLSLEKPQETGKKINVHFFYALFMLFMLFMHRIKIIAQVEVKQLS